MARSGGPLEPPSGGRWEVGLAWRWRRLRDGVPSGLFLVGSAVVILLGGVLVGLLLAKVASMARSAVPTPRSTAGLLPTAPTT